MQIKKSLGIAACLGIAIASFGGVAASAAQVDDGSLSSAERARLLDAGATEPTGGSIAFANDANEQVSPMATAPIGSDGTFVVSSSSTGNNVRNTFSSSVYIANAYTFARIESGSSITTFTGAGDGDVESATRFWATGVAISVSAPAGAGFSLGSAEAVYTGNATDTSTTTTSYSGAEFAGPLFTVNQNVTSTWNVGGNTYIHTTN